MNIIDLGRVIDPAEFLHYIPIAEELETVIHRYGTEPMVPDYPCWIEYQNEGNLEGSIYFTRHTNRHPILSEMVNKISEVMRPIFPEKYAPELDRIHFLKTHGDIPLHRDEGGRLTCINIGLKNSSGAITSINKGGPVEQFQINHTSKILKDGYAYLVNTNEYHAVKSITQTPRYLITYGLGAKFDYFKQFLRLGK